MYSYTVSETEQNEINDAYEKIVATTSNFIKSLDNQNIFEDFFSCVFLLFDGFLSSTHTFTKDANYDYVFFQGLNFSLYPFNGIGCCRHTSELLLYLFQKLGYPAEYACCELSEIPINRPLQRNHVVLEYHLNHFMFFFDLINWNISIKKGNQIISWKKDCWYRFQEKDYMVHNIKCKEITQMYNNVYQKLKLKTEELTKFYENIATDLETISRIIKKYETYQSLQIKYVYE